MGGWVGSERERETSEGEREVGQNEGWRGRGRRAGREGGRGKRGREGEGQGRKEREGGREGGRDQCRGDWWSSSRIISAEEAVPSSSSRVPYLSSRTRRLRGCLSANRRAIYIYIYGHIYIGASGAARGGRDRVLVSDYIYRHMDIDGWMDGCMDGWMDG